ncbi:amiloride-sensitive sodium channel subunit delta [Rhineura floridana]|uniref:amiloride-sensitive sodium channel subunit delta n=1 Tax=Rhineura floridana TaxID=261503 RepID=UPI002AC7F13F|nr:amiloride-sensitive sodium channel subunit delta [Rhineura floridana]XP_061456874.1 amiloride-sensitive sodium channel subunit delta [Rhineura floridana]XP_061456875.1 amiloride-sensitive sodium channel subunit delta [Rhineura floridana]XP_061456876.1 amiloride-sensitive sodium channel subunit delta [Rhineura floridana]
MEEAAVKEKEMETNEEEDAALIEFYSSFKDLFEFFCLNTTIHGTIRLVCSSRNKMKTAFWTLLFLASFAMLYWQFALLFSQYWAYPVVMSMSVHSAPKMFPAITLCNLNPYRVNIVRKNMAELDNLARETLYTLYGFNIPEKILEDNVSISMEDWSNGDPSKANNSNFQLDHSIALVKIGEKVGFRMCNATGGECYTKAYSSGLDAFQEWYRFHYMNIMSQVPPIINVSSEENHIDKLVYACQYNGEPCGSSDTEHFHHPVYGSCYTFNKDGTDTFWTALKPGIAYGLSLILKIEQTDHIPLLSTKAGVKVMIHNHFQTPFLEHEGFDIQPGIKSSIGITQDEVTRLGGNYGECTNSGENVNVKLMYNDTYTQQACLNSCFQHHMIEKCGCGYYYYPLPAGAEYCNYNKYHAWGHCFYLLHNQLYNQVDRHQQSCFKECHRPCKETWYKLSAGYSKWPSSKSEKWIHKALNAQNSYDITSGRKDIAKVNIYYERLDYNSWNESAEFTETLVMSNMGSQWSLWFGSSVLSVVEMFEFLVDAAILSLIFFYRRLTAKRTHKVSRPPRIPSVSLTLEKYRYVEEGLATDQDMVKHYDNYGNDSIGQNHGLPPYPKYNKYQMPELYPGVVLNGFKHRKEYCIDIGPNS